MKRAVSFLLAMMIVTVAFTLASCKINDTVEKISAYSLTYNAVKATSLLDSFEAELDVCISTELLGTDVSIPMNLNLKAAGLDVKGKGDNGKLPVYLLSTENDVLYYYEDGYCYTVAGGVCFKTATKKENTATDTVKTMKSINQALPAILLADVEIIEENGEKSVEVKIPDDVFAEIFESLIENMSEETLGGALDNGVLNGTVSVKDIKAGNATVKISVGENGYVSAYALNFDLDISLCATVAIFSFDYDLSANVDVKLSYVNPGCEVEIVPPEGYLDFPQK